MRIKRLLILAILPMMCLTVNAQNSSKDNTPKEGDFTVAATVGYNSYTSVTAPSGLLTDYEVRALANNWSDKKLMVGFETGWFFKDLWKLNVGGGLSFTNNPGYAAVPGTIDGMTTEINGGNSIEDAMGEVPNYRAVADAQSFGYNLSAGVDRYFSMGKVSNLMWYAGARIGFAYGMNETKYDEETAMGKSMAETWNLRTSLTVGIDYYVLPALYVGAQIDPFAYTYNMTTLNPQAGLGDLSANSHNCSILSAPTIKVGFKF